MVEIKSGPIRTGLFFFRVTGARVSSFRSSCAYTEGGHAGGWDGLARTRYCAPPNDIRPSAAAAEASDRHTLAPTVAFSLQVCLCFRSRRSGVKPTPRVGCPVDGCESKLP